MLKRFAQAFGKENPEDYADLIEDARYRGYRGGVEGQNSCQSGADEAELHQSFSSRKQEFDEDRLIAHREIVEEIEQNTALIRGIGLSQTVAAARQDAVQLVVAHSDALEDAAQSLGLAHRRRLAAEHIAKRPISPNDGGAHLLALAVLFGFVLVEAAANGYLIGLANPFGLMGGISEAFAIAALSITLSYSAGTGIRWVHDRGLPGKIAMIPLIMIFLAVLTFCHLIVGHYRADLAYGDVDAEAARTAVPSALEHGINLPDLYSYALLVVGVFFGIGAAIAGWRSKDHGQVANAAKLAKQHEREKHDWNRLRNDCRSVADQAQGDAMAVADQANQAAISAYLDIGVCIREAEAIERDHTSGLGRLVAAYQTAILAYRGADAKISRQSVDDLALNPPPAIDHSYPFDMDPVANAKAMLADGRTLQTDMAKRVEFAFQNIRSAYSEAGANLEAKIEALRGVTGASAFGSTREPAATLALPFIVAGHQMAKGRSS